MNIKDIICEDLATFRQFKQGPNYTPSQDYGKDKVDPKSIKQPAQQTQSKATTTTLPAVAPVDSSERETAKAKRKSELFNTFNKQATTYGKTPYFSQYLAGTCAVSVVTDNGVRVGVGIPGAYKPEMIFIFENITDKNKEALSELMTEFGYKRTPTALTKFRFIPSNPTDIVATLKELWHIVAAVEELGPDFKSRAGGGNGAGSLITNPQTPYQYYKWIASNIYESVKNNTSWGFSRGGGDSGGAYDKYDKLITVGITKGGIAQQKSGKNAYREHVVPCDLINQLGIDIARKYPKTAKYRNQAIIEIADMIRRNLAVVLCSEYEGTYILDKFNGWQTKMPEGWDPVSGNILDRFIKAKLPEEYIKLNKLKKDTVGIPVYHRESGKRIAEDN